MIGAPEQDLLAAGAAFDAIAERFDDRFSVWDSVTAQRRAVYAALIAEFPEGSRLLEIGGGTGIDAAWLKAQGRSVLLTDASPAMVRMAARKLGDDAVAVAAAEHLGFLATPEAPFDGAFSNFAALNCVTDLKPVGEGLAGLVRVGGRVALVVFGCCCPGEVITEAVRRRPRNMFRRFQRGDVPAQLSGRHFQVRYHTRGQLAVAMAPHFRLVRRQAVGLFVPPSAAEPWISRHPRLLAVMEAADRLLSRPLAVLGDHILYVFERVPDAEGQS